jgi:hypothetical protein
MEIAAVFFLASYFRAASEGPPSRTKLTILGENICLGTVALRVLRTMS